MAESGWDALARDVVGPHAAGPAPFHPLTLRTVIQFLPVRDRVALEPRYGLLDGVKREYDDVARRLPDRVSEDQTVPKSADLDHVQQVIARALLRIRHDLGLARP